MNSNMKYNVKHLSESRYRKITEILQYILEGSEKLRLEIAFMCLWGVIHDYLIPQESNYWKEMTINNLILDIKMIENVDKRIYEIIDLNGQI